MTTILELLSVAIVMLLALPGTTLLFEKSALFVKRSGSSSKQKIKKSIEALRAENNVQQPALNF